MLAVNATVTAQSCSSQIDGSIDLSVSGGTPSYTYQWSPSGSSGADDTGLPAGTYGYTVTDSHGCVVSGSSTVSLSSAINLQATVVQPLCPPLSDGSIAINPSGGNPGYTYTWSDATHNASDQQLGPGVYIVTVTDSKGCTDMDTFTLAYQGHLTVSAGINDTIDLGNDVTLVAVPSPNAADISYVWSPDYNLSCTDCQATLAAPFQTITYTVNASDTNGCRAIDSVTVFVNKTYNLYVPNAFSPNGNGVNDYYQIFGDKASWKYVDIKIFDRWGEKVFESTDLDFKWDGTYRGLMQEPDVFVYILNVTFIDGHDTGILKGSITLIR